ncbi:hypothetical protein [Xanthocytophaga flava]|uniref:hypothetical protein n=1 Tax=Xanthocytophaga flava TaxID=3048013 RepID=UPI0028D7C04F|nr:hypothetical protein [Xanthocytophaga flavus]MDJ1470258.1 hypothetical protein [Xanthocytophaga flavus]
MSFLADSNNAFLITSTFCHPSGKASILHDTFDNKGQKLKQLDELRKKYLPLKD